MSSNVLTLASALKAKAAATGHVLKIMVGYQPIEAFMENVKFADAEGNILRSEAGEVPKGAVYIVAEGNGSYSTHRDFKLISGLKLRVKDYPSQDHFDHKLTLGGESVGSDASGEGDDDSGFDGDTDDLG